jgi:geranylgeranyl reductase family protein
MKSTQDRVAAVVGGSAVGCYCARELASRGIETVVFEENDEVGKFGKCSAIYSKKGLESLGINYPKPLNEIRGARIKVLGRNAEFSVLAKKTIALVLSREELDERIADEAIEAGAKILNKKRLERCSQGKEDGEIKLGFANGSGFSCDALVGADGFASTVAKSLGFPPLDNLVMGCEAEFERVRVRDSRSVELFFSQGISRDFFSWVIPVNEETARIGFATSNFSSIKDSRNKLFESPEIKEILGKTPKLVREFYHPIPLGPRKKTQFGNALLVGDAAGQTKATTGGGVIFGCSCARVAASEIAGNFFEGKKINYEKNWRRKFGTTLGAHVFLRKFFNKLSDSNWNGLLGIFSAARANAVLETIGDMDFVVRV